MLSVTEVREPLRVFFKEAVFKGGETSSHFSYGLILGIVANPERSIFVLQDETEAKKGSFRVPVALQHIAYGIFDEKMSLIATGRTRKDGIIVTDVKLDPDVQYRIKYVPYPEDDDYLKVLQNLDDIEAKMAVGGYLQDRAP